MDAYILHYKILPGLGLVFGESSLKSILGFLAPSFRSVRKLGSNFVSQKQKIKGRYTCIKWTNKIYHAFLDLLDAP